MDCGTPFLRDDSLHEDISTLCLAALSSKLSHIFEKSYQISNKGRFIQVLSGRDKMAKGEGDLKGCFFKITFSSIKHV